MNHPYSPTAQNLAELYFHEILDTDEESQFNDIVDLASLICDCPISTISFIDKERQWYKAKKNVSIEETSLNISICAYTSWQGKTLVVEDALLDERFSNFSNVTGGIKIRFYAGVPIRTSSGAIIGTLCVIDTKPRTINLQQLQAVEKLARQVSSLLELRLLNKHLERTTTGLLKNTETHREFFNHAPLPQWIIGLSDYKILAANSAAKAFYGFTAEEFEAISILDILEYDEGAFAKIREDLKAKGKFNHITTHKKKGGEKALVDLTLSTISFEGHDAIIASIIDLTEKHQMLQRMENEKINSAAVLEKNTLVIQRQEREYLGRELHDNISQMLASVKLYLDIAYSDTEIRLKMIEQCKEYLMYTMDEVRKLSHNMVNKGTAGLDLKEAIQEVIKSYLVADTFKITYTTEGGLNLLPVDVKISILRIVQEAMQNIAKYAGATEVSIELKADEKVELLIRDNGVGFDSKAETSGIGIKNMKERASKANGTFSFINMDGTGCTIQVVIPSPVHTKSSSGSELSQYNVQSNMSST